MSGRRGRLVVAVMLLIGVLPIGTASAADTPAHAAAQILAVRDQALADMDAVVIGLATEIGGLETQAQADAAGASATAEVEAIWVAARKAIDDLTKLYPGSLSAIGSDAKQTLQQRRNSARNEIKNLVEAWAPGTATTTTTTLVPETTTTTSPATTTTSPPPGNGQGGGNGNGGATGGGGGNGAGNGSGSTGSGGTGSVPAPPGSGSGASEAGPRVGPDPTPPIIDVTDSGSSIGAEGIDNELLIALPALDQSPVIVDPQEPASEPIASTPSATAAMTHMLDTVLPPAVVDLVLSPLLVLEILVRTTLDDGRRVLGPLSLLALSALLIGLAERAVRRHTLA